MNKKSYPGLRVASLVPLLALAACGEGSSNSQTVDSVGIGPSAPPSGPSPSMSGPSATLPVQSSSPMSPVSSPVGPTGPAPSNTPSASNPGPTAAVGPSGTSSTPNGMGGASGMGPAGGGGGMGGELGMGGASAGGAGGSAPTTPAGEPEGEWGLAENPGAGCTVPEMPSVDALVANSQLPDPFTKMDGTRITDKSEWRCRREEILQQGYAFIYGDKPVPPEGAVSGEVSERSITVEVSDNGNSTSFSVSVNMNGATAPAPAIIQYGGGAPSPNGVATISFSAIEMQGGSGPKSGPFYDVYGSDHPAGYLVAQAWQVSRILDVLEQNPGVIDPTRVGVTGCSRLGKGAFVAGVLDNRIALTIPVESGLGGTIGLRLVEVLDSYSGSEWPYHGISYVRWMSEVALGQFTTGNSAGADNTDKLPVDMHEMMGLIAPRGLFIADNPGMYNGLDRNAAWVTANVGKLIFEGLGVADHFGYQGASGSHCDPNFRYTAALQPMIQKFLLGDDSAETGNFTTDLGNPPNPDQHHDWDVPTLAGEL